MPDRFFLDTNIFVYAFDRTAPQKSHRAHELIRTAVVTGRGIVSYQVVQEFFNVALRRFSEPLTAAEAGQFLATVFKPLLAVYASLALYSEALNFTSKYGLSWYDSLIVASAIEGKCQLLYSEDFQHRQRFGNLAVENPFK
jgi:predicted nucleic acid-binding protein